MIGTTLTAPAVRGHWLGPVLGLMGLLLVMAAAAATPARALELLYVRDPACPWCREWERVIGPIYPKSAEGKRAPLRATVLRDIAGSGVRLRSPVRYTPTFILVDGTTEIGRIEGYPGEEFFWLRLEQLLDQAEPAPDAVPTPAPAPGVTRTRLDSAG